MQNIPERSASSALQPEHSGAEGVEDTIRRLMRWAQYSLGGLARVEYQDETLRLFVVDKLKERCQQTGIAFTRISLPVHEDARQVVRFLIRRLNQMERERMLVSVEGWATAFPDGVALEEALDLLNQSRDRLVEHPFCQVWWMRPEMADVLLQSFSDLNSWFLVRLDLTSEEKRMAGHPGREITETQELVERLRQAEEERTRLQYELRQSIEARRHFLRSILFSVTDGVFRLCSDPEELPEALPNASPPLFLAGIDNLGQFRAVVKTAAESAGFPEESIYDLVTGAQEAAMNAVIHGGGGVARICWTPQGNTIQVWITDQGSGIMEAALHRATLERGFSTGGTHGHGFALITATCDRVWLLTTPTGTTVVLEKDRNPTDSSLRI